MTGASAVKAEEEVVEKDVEEVEVATPAASPAPQRQTHRGPRKRKKGGGQSRPSKLKWRSIVQSGVAALELATPHASAAPPPPPLPGATAEATWTYIKGASGSVALSLAELDAATGGFGAERKIGSGGFGDVFMGELASLHGQQGVAVKRAKAGLDLAGLEREVAILTNSHHPHLLPLLGHCLEAFCLVFPLMKGGSLQSRLDLEASDLQSLDKS